MPKPVRFQFTLVSEKAIGLLQETPSLYRSLFVEAAVKAWFQDKCDKRHFNLNHFHSCKKNVTPIRYRISISDASLMQSLRRIPVRHRSLVVELAIISWSESEFGSQIIKMCCDREKRNLADPNQTEDEKASVVDHKAITENRTDPETLELMKTMLEFK